jgi:predicted ester cyclase
MKPVLWYSLGLIAFFFVACQPTDPVKDATAKLKPVVDAYINAWNTGNVDTLAAICDSNMVRYEWGNRTRGVDSLRELIKSERTMLPNLKLVVDQELYVGNHAVLRLTASATNTGPGAFPPTGKSFTLTTMSLFTFVNGKLTEERAENNGLSFFEQLGFKLTPPSK